MTDGVSLDLKDLIELQRFAQSGYSPQGRGFSAGNHLSKFRGRGMDFNEVRNYQAGDDLRHMEWRVTARSGRPHIKLYQEERERPVLILVDFNPSMFFGTRIAFKSVIAARLAAILAWTVVKQGDRVGGLLFSATGHNEFTPRSREFGVLPFLASISEYTKTFSDPTTSQTRNPLSYGLERLRRVVRPGSIVVLISDFYNFDEDSERHLARLQSHNDILAYHICDPIELAPPRPDIYAITNGSQEILLDTTNNIVSKAYHHYSEHRIAELRLQLQRLQIQYIQVRGDLDLPLLVRQTFFRRINA